MNVHMGNLGFMNYVIPEHVLEGASRRLRRLLGFLEHGAYG